MAKDMSATVGENIVVATIIVGAVLFIGLYFGYHAGRVANVIEGFTMEACPSHSNDRPARTYNNKGAV